MRWRGSRLFLSIEMRRNTLILIDMVEEGDARRGVHGGFPRRVAESLNGAENKLRVHRRALVQSGWRRNGTAGDRRQERENAAGGGSGTTGSERRCHRAHPSHLVVGAVIAC